MPRGSGLGPEPRAEGGRFPRKEAPPKEETWSSEPREFRSRPRPCCPDPQARHLLVGWAGSLRADPRCGTGKKRHRSSAVAASRTYRGEAAPLRARPAPPQRCEPPPTLLLLPEGSACSGCCHHHSPRRRRRPVSEAAQPPRFRSSSGSRENFPRAAPPRPRETCPSGKGPERKRSSSAEPSQVDRLDARAHAPGRPAAGGTGAAPPPSRCNPLDARAGKLQLSLEGITLMHTLITSLPLPPNQVNAGSGGESAPSMKYSK